jgi:hypothetical protein
MDYTTFCCKAGALRLARRRQSLRQARFEFAAAYKMNAQDAYFYLKKYGGWDYITRHWWALHTDNHYYALNDIYEFCYKNGGLK